MFRQPYSSLTSLTRGQYRFGTASMRQWLQQTGLALVFGLGLSAPALAAERLTVRIGPFRQAVAIADLEKFADTGTLPPALASYSAVLNNDVQLALASRMKLDPDVADKLVDELLQSSAGERLLNVLQMIIPGSTADELKATLIEAAKDSTGLSVVGFLKAYPKETLTVDVVSAVTLASQMNLPYWKSQALSSILERELTVPTAQAPIEADFDPTESGFQWVRQRTLILRDYDRDRVIPVELYWSRRTKGPLIVISHGFGADRRFLGYLAHHLASYGFTVAALEHPGSNVARLAELTSSATQTGKLGEILPATEFIDRPTDVSFLLDQLERINRYSLTMRGRFNTKQVTVIGHSLGGYTAFALAGARLNPVGIKAYCAGLGATGLSPADWLECTAADLPNQQPDLKDPRIAQIVAFNPVMGHLFDAQSLAQIKVPTLVLAGTDDAIIPAVSQQLLPFNSLTTQKYLLTAIGGTHLSVGDPSNLNYALTQTFFVRERRNDETEQFRQLVQGVTLAFVKQLTPEAKLYQPFLTSAYAQSFSTDTLRLRLNAEIPPKLSNWLKVSALPLEKLVASTLPQPKPWVCFKLLAL
jgi:predicted dienelactone hydrolase